MHQKQNSVFLVGFQPRHDAACRSCWLSELCLTFLYTQQTWWDIKYEPKLRGSRGERNSRSGRRRRKCDLSFSLPLSSTTMLLIGSILIPHQLNQEFLNNLDPQISVEPQVPDDRVWFTDSRLSLSHLTCMAYRLQRQSSVIQTLNCNLCPKNSYMIIKTRVQNWSALLYSIHIWICRWRSTIPINNWLGTGTHLSIKYT